jgi:hypothetical protein
MNSMLEIMNTNVIFSFFLAYFFNSFSLRIFFFGKDLKKKKLVNYVEIFK